MNDCQRWRDRRGTYRPAGEPIDPRRFGVEPIADDGPAKAFVERHHYSGSFPAARCRVGLYRTRAFATPELVGVAVFSQPPSEAVLPKWLGVPGVDLGRLVLLDDVEANGESWFLARAFRIVRRELPEIRAVLSCSDPFLRTALDGRVTCPGHVGTVYQALGGRHLGRTNRSTILLDGEGRTVSPRALSKLRTGSRGRDYVERRLVAAGAPRREPGEDGAAYVTRLLRADVFRRVRHPGNLVYAWPFDPHVVLRAALPYPKRATL